jgi:hypothetical protein
MRLNLRASERSARSALLSHLTLPQKKCCFVLVLLLLLLLFT